MNIVAPDKLVLTGVTMAQLTFRWRDKSNNETGFEIERCQGGSCTNFIKIAETPANVTQYTDQNLLGNTTYRYRVRAINKKGVSGYTNILTATTSPDTPPVNPSTPTGLTGVAGDQKATLTWNAVTGATYKLFRNNVQIIANLAVLTYIDTGLTNGLTYNYTIVASANGVDSSLSAPVSVTPIAPPPVPSPPAKPTELSATAGDAQIQLAWGFVPAAVTYNVKRSTVSGGPYTTINSPTDNNYLDTGVVNGTRYYYVVSAVNQYGESPNSSEVNELPQVAAPPPPPPPPPPPQVGPVIDILPGFSLQGAINDAVQVGGGVTIRVATGYDFIGNPFLPARSNGITDYITIISMDSNGISGGRINPTTQGASLARLRSNSGGYAALRVLANAHHYQLIGLDLSINSADYVPDVVSFEDTSIHHIIIDRCFIHPIEISASQLSTSLNYRTSGRGIHLLGSNLTVTKSYIAGFAGLIKGTSFGIDSYGIYSDAGPGPLYIYDDYIEANFNNVFFGGADTATDYTATITGATTTSATFSNVINLHVNDLVSLFYTTPFTTSGGSVVNWGTVKVSAIVGNVVTYAGYGPSGNLPGNPDSPGIAMWNGVNIQWDVKDCTLLKRPEWVTQGFGGQWKAFCEVKSAIDSNFEHNDMVGNGFHGNAIALTPRNQNGSAPWMTCRRLKIKTNRIRGSIGAIVISSLTDNQCTSTPGGDVDFGGDAQNKGNLVEGPTTNDNYNYLFNFSGGDNLLIQHNTIAYNGTSNVAVADLANPNLTFKDNICGGGIYGWSCFVSPNTFPTCWPSFTETNNLIVNSLGAPNIYPNSTLVADYAAVKFISSTNWGLQNTSPGYHAASDGSDIGMDMTAVPQ